MEHLPPSPPPDIAVSFETTHLCQAFRCQHTLLKLRPHCNSIGYSPAVPLDYRNRDFAAWQPLRMRSRILGRHRSAPGSSSCLCLFHSLHKFDQTYFRMLTLLGVDVLCELNGVIALVGDLIPEVVLLLLLLLHVELQLRIHKHSD